MFSVVIPTFNRSLLIRETLDSLLAQDTDLPFEIIVVDNNSSDDTGAVIRSIERETSGKVRYVFEAAQGSSAARNAGIAVSQGEIIAFVDDDTVADPGWLRALAAAYRAHPDAWCVGGKVVLRLPEALPPWFDPHSRLMGFYLSAQDRGDEAVRVTFPDGLITANFSVTREAVARVGVFNTDLGRFATGLLCGEDIEFCHRIQRAGGSVYYDGRAVVVHLVPEARLTRRFFRSRAVWEGRTDGLLRAVANPAPSLRGLGSAWLVMAKDTAISLAQRAAGNPRAALEHELAARKRLGYLQQALTARRRPRPTDATQQAPAARGPSLTVRVVRDLEGLQALGGPWNDLATRADSGIFQTFEWQATWTRILAADTSLHVMTVWDGADLVGIAPLSVSLVPFAGLPLIRRMRFLGRGDSDYLDLIVARGYESHVAERLADHLVASSDLWEVVELEDVPEDSPAMAPFLKAMAERGCRIRRTLHKRSLGAKEKINWRYEVSAPGITAACRIGAHLLIRRTSHLTGRVRAKAAAVLHKEQRGRR